MLTPGRRKSNNHSYLNHTDKNDQKNTSIVSISEFLRIKDSIFPDNEESRRKMRDTELKNLSTQRMKKWPDSIEMIRKNQLEARKQRFLDAELVRRTLDETEARYQEHQKKIIIENANKILFDSQDNVKSLKSKLLYSDVLKEREYQKEIKKQKEEFKKQIDHSWMEVEKDNQFKYDEKEKAKHQLEKQKREEQMQFINQQFKESKLNRIRNYQDYVVEGQIIKQNAKQAAREDM